MSDDEQLTRTPKSSRLRLSSVLILFQAGRARGLATVALVLFSGLTEIVGVMSILPLLQLTGGGDDRSAPGVVNQVFDLFGLTMSVGSLLTVTVIGLVLKACFFILAMRHVGNLAADIVTNLRLQLLQAVAEARWSYFVRKPLGSLANAIGTEAMRVSQMLTQSCFFLAAAVQVVVYVTAAFLVSLSVTIVSLGVGGFLIVVLNALIKMSRRAGERETVSLKSLLSRLVSLLTIMKPAKAMARERGLLPILRTESQNLNSAYRKQVLSKSILLAAQEPLIAFFLSVGLYAALTKGTPIEELLFLSLLFYRILTRIGNAQDHLQTLSTLESAYHSLRSSIDEALASRESVVTAPRPVHDQQMEIELNHVKASYDGQTVFTDLSIQIRAGDFTAVVGPSGVGKTTLLDLVCGLIDPDEGEITVGDIPLQELDKRAWRRQIGYIPQTPVLIDGTIFTNVVLGEEGLNEDDARTALAKAGAMEFIERLPKGIHTEVGEQGASLSGGQRQRIMVARALVRSPRLLICDEATSALDRETEQNVLETLKALGITILAVSHHDATTRFADRVFKLAGDGEVHLGGR